MLNPMVLSDLVTYWGVTIVILFLQATISIIFHHFLFSTDSANQFLKTSIQVEFAKNPGIEPMYKRIDDTVLFR